MSDKPNELRTRVTSLLARHQHRRDQGLPTLSVLVGPCESAVTVWRAWAESSGRRMLVCTASNEVELVSQVLRDLSVTINLIDVALAWVASMFPGRPALSRGRLDRMTPLEFEDFWQAFVQDRDLGPASTAVERILRGVRGESFDSASLEAYITTAPVSIRGQHLAALFQGLIELVAPVSMPALIVTCTVNASSDLSIAVSRLLTSLVTAVPALACALQIAPTEFAGLEKAGTDSRLFALLREGLVELKSAASCSPASVRSGGQPGTFEAALQYLVRIGASRQATALLTEAARCLDDSSPATEDRARSVAERFLYEVLEALPTTAGQFKLNHKLEFSHGSQRAEGDLVAPAARVAVELDGGYYHLADPEAYRRDRKKDYSYQKHGYLVLRFLSEDVVVRLEEIVHTITEALPRTPPGV